MNLLVNDVRNRLKDKGIGIEMSESAKEWLSKEGFDPVYGARPLRRAVQRYVENPLSNRILAGAFSEGDSVLVDTTTDGLTYAKVNMHVEASV